MWLSNITFAIKCKTLGCAAVADVGHQQVFWVSVKGLETLVTDAL